MIHAQCPVAIFSILYLDRTSALTCIRAQYTCRQLAVVIQICVDCTAINNQVNNINSLPSGPCIQWGGGGGGGVQLHLFAPPWLRACHVSLHVTQVLFIYMICSTNCHSFLPNHKCAHLAYDLWDALVTAYVVLLKFKELYYLQL